MIIKVVGIEHQKFTFDDGTQYEGKKLHAITLDETSNNVIGTPVTVIKLPSKSEFFSKPIDVGKEYLCFFDQKGKVAYFAEKS